MLVKHVHNQLIEHSSAQYFIKSQKVVYIQLLKQQPSTEKLAPQVECTDRMALKKTSQISIFFDHLSACNTVQLELQ